MQQNGDSQTKLYGAVSQVREFAKKLLSECDEVDESGITSHVSHTLEQTKFDGPWRLVITICADNN